MSEPGIWYNELTERRGVVRSRHRASLGSATARRALLLDVKVAPVFQQLLGVDVTEESGLVLVYVGYAPAHNAM